MHAEERLRRRSGVRPRSPTSLLLSIQVTRMAHVMHRSPFMVHTTFQYGGTEGKRHRLREGMMWEDDDEYATRHPPAPSFRVPPPSAIAMHSVMHCACTVCTGTTRKTSSPSPPTYPTSWSTPPAPRACSPHAERGLSEAP